MNVRQIEVFRAVFQTRSISSGARQLNVSQPSVSRMIRHLEDQLGYRLFELTKGRIMPTHQANILFHETEGLTDRLNRVADLARNLRSGNGERLAVLSYYSFAMEMVPRALHAVAKVYPDLSISLGAKSPADQVIDIMRMDADVGIAGNIGEMPGLEQRNLGTDTIVAILREDHPDASKKVLSLGNLSRMPCITSPVGSPVGLMLRNAFGAAGLDFLTNIEISSPVPVFELVRLFGYVALIGARAAGTLEGRQGLLIKPLSTVVEYPVQIFWNRNAFPSPARSLFIDKMMEEFHNSPDQSRRSS